MADYESYKRACIRLLATHGIPAFPQPERTIGMRSANVDCFDFSDEDRYTCWLAEAILHGFRSVEMNDAKMALRSTFQAFEYNGRLGRDPLAYCDALSALKNACEALTEDVSTPKV